MNRHIFGFVWVALLCVVSLMSMASQAPTRAGLPAFQADRSWPSIPNNWVLGEVSSIAVDAQDHVWILHRPATVPEAQRSKAAPPVLEFEASGRFVRGWGGPGTGYDWPE